MQLWPDFLLIFLKSVYSRASPSLSGRKYIIFVFPSSPQPRCLHIHASTSSSCCQKKYDFFPPFFLHVFMQPIFRATNGLTQVDGGMHGDGGPPCSHSLRESLPVQQSHEKRILTLGNSPETSIMTIKLNRWKCLISVLSSVQIN